MKTKFLIICLLFASQAIAEELRKPRFSETDLLSRVEQMEQNISGLQKQIYAAPPKSSGANSKVTNNFEMDEQLDNLNQQLKTLRGEIEQLQFDNTKLKDRFEKFAEDSEFRFNELSQSKVAAVPAKTANPELDKLKQKSVTDKAGAVTNEQAADDLYQDAYSAFKAHSYDKAIKLFEEFIAKNPNHSMVANAYFWLGETSFEAERYDKSALNYLKSYQQNPKGIKAADSLLKLGNSLAKLHKNKEACVAFIKLKKEFPNAAASITRRVEEQISSLNCQ